MYTSGKVCTVAVAALQPHAVSGCKTVSSTVRLLLELQKIGSIYQQVHQSNILHREKEKLPFG